MTIPMPIQETIKNLSRQGTSERQIAKQLNISRNTVGKYVNKTDFSPTPRIDDRKSVVNDYSHIIEGWLRDDLKQPKKQRHTAKRIHERLVTEHNFPASYRIVARWLQERKMLQPVSGNGFLELEWGPGFAQADFGEATIILDRIKKVTHALVEVYQ